MASVMAREEGPGFEEFEGFENQVAELPGPVATPAPLEPALTGLAPITLTRGQLSTLDVSEVQRVAIGKPEIADVTIVSPSQLLLQAKGVGITNLIIWDADGQRETTVTVAGPTQETIRDELRQLLDSLKFSAVEVRPHGGRLVMYGEVESQARLDILEHALSAYPDVVNLVTVSPSAPPPPKPPEPLVKLAVQLVELNRTEIDKLGVKWSESVKLTEPQATDVSLSEALTRFGASLTRGEVGATIEALVRRNKARLLSEPTLVTSSGKEASTFVGLEVPIITATSFSTSTSAVSASIEFRETGVLLKMTPHVHPGGAESLITVVVSSEVSSVDTSVQLKVPVGNTTADVPGFSVRKTNTEVTTVSGGSIVIAGLLQTEDKDSVDQVPALGSVPVLGRLFRSPSLEGTQRELVIAITPELLEGPSVAAAPLRQEAVSGRPDSQRASAIEQALTGREAMFPPESVTAVPADPTARYALQVLDRIAAALRYPALWREGAAESRVKLRLRLLRNGSLQEATIASSSGVAAFDDEALRAARAQAPYPPFPHDLNQPDLWLELPVVFR